MYHFIRRFFIVDLVFASIFSLLLCIAPRAHTQYPTGQIPNSPFSFMPTFAGVGVSIAQPYSSFGLSSYAAYSPIRSGVSAEGLASSNALGLLSYASDMFQQGGALASLVLMYSPPVGRTPSFGLASPVMDRTGFPLSTAAEKYHLLRPSPTFPGGSAGAYGFPGAASVQTVYKPTFFAFDERANQFAGVIPSRYVEALGLELFPTVNPKPAYGGYGSLGYGQGSPSYPVIMY